MEFPNAKSDYLKNWFFLKYNACRISFVYPVFSFLMVVFEKVTLCLWINKSQSHEYQKTTLLISSKLHAIAFFY